MGTTQLGVDWVSMGIFAAAYALSQVHALPIKLRYGVLAAAMAAIGVYRMRLGLQNINAVFTALAGVLCVYYVVKVFTSHDQPRSPRDEE